MTTKIPIIQGDATVAELEQFLLKKVKELETINYIYITDAENHLKGVASIKEVFRSAKSKKLKQIDIRKLVTVHAGTHQEQVVYTALKHNLKAVPVVDEENHLLGAVPSDVLLRILDNEAVENILKFGGIAHNGNVDNVLKLPILQSLKHRLPWLLLGLLGGVATAGIVGSFEETLSKNLILAAFIPLIVYMADAVGAQMQVFIIRDLATKPKLALSKYFFHQVPIIATIGALTSALLFLLSFLIYREETVSLVLAIALFFAILSSMVTGLVVPFLFGKIKLDPANASGPIATIIQDLLSVLVYLGTATWLL